MTDLRRIGLKVAKYKCFDTPAGFDQILPFNIIIGRNNVGKSALLDLLAFIVTRQNNQMLTLDNRDAEIDITDTVTAQDIARHATPPISPEQLSECRLTWRLGRGKQEFQKIEDSTARSARIPPDFWRGVVAYKSNPFFGLHFARLTAERDIKPEKPGNPEIDPDGYGLTRTIHHFRSHQSRDSKLVEKQMLNDLNTIFGPDTQFTRIDTRERDGEWEVVLDEERKGRIPLSRSGSGLKTIILVLAYLHLLPVIKGTTAESFLYGFEELENNLHPAVQRRLLHYLKAQSAALGCTFLLTTHAPIEIDYFARDRDAQVIHVTHDGAAATTNAVSGYLHGRGILDDLDIRASDLLQSNGIIWVEGPSDRLYLNRWIELWTNGTLREGAHYQILQYGGALLAHLDAEALDTDTPTIHVLTVNRNAAVLMDSDQREATTPRKRTASRIIAELTRTNGLAWVTAGRTIENYLHPDMLGTAPGQYEDIISIIATQNATAEHRLPTDKVKLARMITPRLTREHLAILDLEARIQEICARIAAWNTNTPQEQGPAAIPSHA